MRRKGLILITTVVFWFLGADLQQESQKIFYTVQDACEIYFSLRVDREMAVKDMPNFIKTHGESSEHMCWVLLKQHETGKYMGVTRWETWLATTSVWRRALVLFGLAITLFAVPLYYAYRNGYN